VDKIGGLDDAIVSGLFSKIKKLQYSKLSNMRKILMILLANFPFAKSKADFIKEEIGVENYRILQEIKLQTRKGVQAIMPFETYIKNKYH
jgi:protease-4